MPNLELEQDQADSSQQADGVHPRPPAAHWLEKVANELGFDTPRQRRVMFGTDNAKKPKPVDPEQDSIDDWINRHCLEEQAKQRQATIRSLARSILTNRASDQGTRAFNCNDAREAISQATRIFDLVQNCDVPPKT